MDTQSSDCTLSTSKQEGTKIWQMIPRSDLLLLFRKKSQHVCEGFVDKLGEGDDFNNHFHDLNQHLCFQ